MHMPNFIIFTVCNHKDCSAQPRVQDQESIPQYESFCCGLNNGEDVI